METKIAFEGDTLTVTRMFDADRTRVFRSWSEPQRFAAWAGCPGATSRGATIDFRVGGRYRNTLQLPDGTSMVMVGEYLEIVPLERIVYSLEWEGLGAPATTVSVDLFEAGGLTRVVLRHSGLSGPDMLREVPHGWQASFDRLVADLAKRSQP